MYEKNPPLTPKKSLPTMYDNSSEHPDEFDPNAPLPAKETLPTMYDLPSEYVGESGLPDEFHIFQPQLLRETFQASNYPKEEILIATDLNIYYDVHHQLWYKRPDWFTVLGVSRGNQQQDLRLSYVIWQEGVSPFMVVELLSPGTEQEDLGQTLREINKPPTKWEVYEQILRIPYYVVFDRYTNILRVFQLVGTRFQEMALSDEKVWLDEIELGLGVWQGSYQDIQGKWLRWYDAQQNWIPTLVELAEQQRAKAERLAARLRELGVNPEDL
ncbi:Uma2 family endonuclease [Rivularia sp. UHCC 0363]|uniref:Uma2 family endonuclease n=1 Tax=Rivularia sp. UHCC 0363 TaxID=3110244 RepID=UPI002B1E9525|nr:Uma2 family endonuclease [Rivularia sp. UHCC 0363]MEA5597422.1 Uma2 family endonuclease [Rivularia sp. UHCC 0363]